MRYPFRALKKYALRILLGLVAVAGLLGLAFAFSNCGDAKAPPPLWTEADFPELPDAHANGWTVLSGEFKDEEAILLGEAQGAMWQALEADSVDDLRGSLAKVKVGLDTAGSVLDRCELAFERPRFAYDCALNFDEPCQALTAFRCHAAWSAGLLLRGADRASDTKTRFARQVAKDIDFVSTATTLLGQVIASQHLIRTASVAQWLRTHQPAALEGVDYTVLCAAKIDPEKAAMGEYLLLQGAIRDMAKETGRTRWLFDEGATLQLLNTAFEPAKAGRATAIKAPPRPTFWWWHNAAGRALVETALLSDAFSRLEDNRVEFAGRCRRLK